MHQINFFQIQRPQPFTVISQLPYISQSLVFASTKPFVATRPHRQHIQLTDIYQLDSQPSQNGPITLTIKKPQDSYIEDNLNLDSDENLKTIYSTPCHDFLRIGLVLEDMDILAGRSAYLHSDGFNINRPLSIVTACVDSIQIEQSHLPNSVPYKYQSAVTHVGRSSMEISVLLSNKLRPDIDAYTPAIRAQFVMVAKDFKSQRSAIVHPLDPNDSPLFKELSLPGAKEKRARRLELSKSSLKTNPPVQHEMQMVHSHLLAKQPDWIEMNSTIVHNNFLSHRTDRNIHGRLFGGAIMRSAFELAYVTAHNHVYRSSGSSHTHPQLIKMEDVVFRKPIDIGSILHFQSVVTQVSPDHQTCVIQVNANVQGNSEISNQFWFSFQIDDPLLQPVYPESYKNVLEYVESYRRFGPSYGFGSRYSIDI